MPQPRGPASAQQEGDNKWEHLCSESLEDSLDFLKRVLPGSTATCEKFKAYLAAVPDQLEALPPGDAGRPEAQAVVDFCSHNYNTAKKNVERLETDIWLISRTLMRRRTAAAAAAAGEPAGAAGGEARGKTQGPCCDTQQAAIRVRGA